ncbi:MAG: hypothetical protein FJW39_01690 [Acidobacteria bacterium]|nr:hypothetical protein [Acidobacteriota bacterium]
MTIIWTALATAHDSNPGPGYRGGGGGGYGYGASSRGNDPVRLAIRDLETIYSRARVDHHERDHFRKAIGALREFEDRAYRGRFDEHLINRAIEDMSHLAAAQQLHPRARGVIGERMRDLRGFCERGSRGGYPGYRGRY